MYRTMFPRITRHVAAATLALGLFATPFLPTWAPAANAQTGIEAVYEMAVDQLQQGDYQGAIANFSQVLSAGGDVAQAYVGRATARVYTGEFAEALQDLNQAVQLSPELAEAYYNRGVLRARMGDTSGAIADLQQAATLFRNRGDERTAGVALEVLGTLQQ